MPRPPDMPPRDGADMISTRSSLLGRLKNWEDNESWQQFFDCYWQLIYRFARQRGLNHEEAPEVVQETSVAVAKHIGRFKYDRAVCSFKTWLLRGLDGKPIVFWWGGKATDPSAQDFAFPKYYASLLTDLYLRSGRGDGVFLDVLSHWAVGDVNVDGRLDDQDQYLFSSETVGW